MIACLLKGPGNVTVEDVPTPQVGRGDVLVRLKVAGICGTDLEKLHGAYGPGGILGHEVSGIIERVGTDVKGLRKGDHVVAHHHVPCYNCYLCAHGDYTMCDSFKTTNLDPCGLAEHFRVPEFNVQRGAVVPLLESVDFEEAALLEPTACCIRALDKVNIQPLDKALVVGLGPTGLTHLQLLHNRGVQMVLGSDVQQTRLEMARKLGADRVYDPRRENVPEEVKRETTIGVDLVVVSTGNPNGLSQALSSVRKGGQVLLFGAPSRDATFQLDIGFLFGRQISIITSYSCVEGEIERALQLVRQKVLDLRTMVTHRFPLKEATKALESAATSPSAVKTIITG